MSISVSTRLVLINILLLFVIFLSCAQKIKKENLIPPDAPSSQTYQQNSIERPNYSFREAIIKWKTIQDINDWIANNFEYDMERALQLASNSKTRTETNIYRPDELYDYKKGVCIDLVRFAFETIQAMDSTIFVKYLMIEFEPLTIGNRIFKRHWLVVYEENHQLYAFADTKRPGYISGPHEDIADFTNEYEKFRQRKIVTFKLTDTYKKKLKSRLLKQHR